MFFWNEAQFDLKTRCLAIGKPGAWYFGMVSTVDPSGRERRCPIWGGFASAAVLQRRADVFRSACLHRWGKKASLAQLTEAIRRFDELKAGEKELQSEHLGQLANCASEPAKVAEFRLVMLHNFSKAAIKRLKVA